MISKFRTVDLVLASCSPRRRLLLEQFGFNFKVVPPDIEEHEYDGDSIPEDFVQNNAREKAVAVAQEISEGIIIGADTIVVIDNKILEKPESPDDAANMLKLLSGREHSVFTGVCVITQPGLKTIIDYAETRVLFRIIPNDEIDDYVASGEPMGKAGAYAIQERGGIFVKEIHGCYFNIVGLPLAKLLHLLEKVL